VEPGDRVPKTSKEKMRDKIRCEGKKRKNLRKYEGTMAWCTVPKGVSRHLFGLQLMWFTGSCKRETGPNTGASHSAFPTAKLQRKGSEKVI
jgi:hypothetical protein